MKKLVLVWIFGLVLISGPTLVFTDQGFRDKEVFYRNLGDINADGKKEVAQETTNWGVSSCHTVVRILSGNKTIFKLPTFIGDTADGYKIMGNKIVVWQGNWRSVQSKWEPHYYNFTWYGWDAKKKIYVIVQEGLTTNTYNYKTAERSMPFLAQNPNKLNLSRTIVEAVQFYCLNTQSPGWPSPPLQVRYKFKQIKNDWASISTCIVDKKGQMVGEYCCFLVHRLKSRWSVVWFSGERNIHPRMAQQLKISQNIVKELGWTLYEDE